MSPIHGQAYEADTVLGFFNSDDIGAYASYIGSDAAHLFAAFEASLQASLLDQLSASTPSEAVFEHGYSGESSRNLGPHLVEAPWTLGKSGSSYGLTISSLRFRRFDGEPLNNIFDEAAGTGWSDFSLNAQIARLQWNYGLTDELDVGIQVPFIRLHGEGMFATMRGMSRRGPWSRTDVGLGDASWHSKYRLYGDRFRSTETTLSVGADLRFPTGNDDLLLGTGTFGGRVYSTLGKRVGPFYPCLQVGYHWKKIPVREKIKGVSTGLDSNDFDTFEVKAELPTTTLNGKLLLSPGFYCHKSNFDTKTGVSIAAHWLLAYSYRGSCTAQFGVDVPLGNHGLAPDIIPSVGIKLMF